MKKNKGNRLIDTIKDHVINNMKEYFIVSLMFIIGIFLGVMFVNNLKEVQSAEVSTYLNNFIDKFKNTENLESMQILKTSINQNIILALILWFFGTTIIGIPIVFGIVAYRGFCLGYTIAVSISIMGLSKGLLFIVTSVLLQNILFIPAILALAVSGFKLYKSIMKDKRKENIKLEILRHTFFSLIMLGVLFISSIIEIFVSTNILKMVIKYF